jgi:uncharacterized protein YndB with AHSA1/START domain
MYKLEVTTPSDHEVGMTRTFAAPRRLVFDCWTKPELIQRWLFGPDGWSFALCEVDFRVGGVYRFVWRKTDGTEMGMGGTYREIVRPERIVNTELFDEDWTGGETVVTTTFAEEAGRTTVTQTTLFASRAARDGALATGMTDGVEVSFTRLDAVLASVAQQA